MKHVLATLKWTLIGSGALLALVVVGLYVFTRTPWGVERVGRFALHSIAGGIDGRLEVGGIASRALTRGVTLRGVKLEDRVGHPFLQLDSVRATYRWSTLLSGRIVLSSLELFRPRVVVEELPGDTLWNYQRIFRDTGAASGPPRLVRFADVAIHGGEVTVAYPYALDARVQPADTARLLLRRVEGGVQRVLRFDELNARLPNVLWQSPEEAGQRLTIGQLSGRGFIWSVPVVLRRAGGTVVLRDSLIRFDLPRLELPESQAGIAGRVVLHEAANLYDVQILTSRLAFADLRWLYPRLPDGGGSGTIHIRTVSNGTLWSLSGARLHAPGTTVSGSFGLVTGRSLYFTDVNLRAAPFDLKVVQAMLPRKLPIDGLLEGTVVAQGPLSALRTHGDLRLSTGSEDPHPSAVRWNGTLDARRPFGATGFRADLDSLDLGLLTAVDSTLHLRGTLSGRIDASGRLDRSVRLVADLQHQLPGYTASRLTGSGDVTWTPHASNFDLQFQAAPLALKTLAHTVPALERLKGEVRGPVTVQGSLADLHVDADLHTPAGQLAVNGRFDLAGARPSFHAAGKLSGFDLEPLITGLPSTSVWGSYQLDGSGSSLDDAVADVRLDVGSGRVGDLPVRHGTVRLALRDGLAQLDTLRLATAAGTLQGSGSFGLRPGQRGTLEIELDADSLGALQPFFFPNAAAETVKRMAGTLRGHATLRGGLDAFDVSADAALSRVHYGSLTAAAATLQLTGSGFGSGAPAWKVDGRADTVRVGALRFPTTTVHGDYTSPAGSLDLEATGAAGGHYALAGDYRLAGDTAELALRDLRFGVGADAWRLAAPAGLRLEQGVLTADSLALTRVGGGSLHAGGTLAWGDAPVAAAAPLAFHLQLARVPIEDFLGLAGAESPAGGRVSGRLDVSGTAAAPVVEGTLAVDSARFRELRLDRLDTRVHYADRSVDGHVQGLAGGFPVVTADGRLPLDLTLTSGPTRLPDEPIAISIQADSLPASLTTTLLGGFRDVRGRLDGRMQIAGTLHAPRFDGRIALQDGGWGWQATGVHYTDARGDFSMAGDGAIRVDASARAGSGRAAVTGRLIVANEWSDPRFDLTAELVNFWTAHRAEADVTASGRLHLGGRYRAPVVSGTVRVDRGVLYVDEIWRQYNIVALDDSLLSNVVDTTVSSIRKVISEEAESDFMRNLTVDSFTVDVGRDAWLRGKEMNVEVSGNLGVVYRRAADDLRLSGQLNAVRGTYSLYSGHRFDVKSGTIDFFGTNGLNPQLDITAVYKARSCENTQPLNIQATVTSTLDNPRVALSSDAQPAVSQSDLVSCLLFGVPTYRLTPAQGQRTAQLVTDATAPVALGWASSGLESVGRNVGLDYVSLYSGEAVQPAAEGGLFNYRNLLAGTRIDVGRYVGDDLFLAFSAGVPAPGSTTPFRGARLEWRLRPTWTGEFFVDDRAARIPSLGYSLDPAAGQKKVLGFFFYREWGY